MMLGLDMGRSLTLWHNPDWDISHARKSILPVVPADPSAGFRLGAAISDSGGHQRVSGLPGDGAPGRPGAGATAGTEGAGAGFQARTDRVYRVETGAGVSGDRLYRRHRESLLAGAAAAGSQRRGNVRSGGNVGFLDCRQRVLSFLLYINWTQMTVEGQDLSELVARVAFLAMAGNLANSLAKDLRIQSEKH